MNPDHKSLIITIGLLLIALIIITVQNADTIDGNSMLTEIVKANGGCK